MQKNRLSQGYTAPALGKGLEVLELLANESGPLTPGQIARKLGRTTSEIYRVILTLEKRHYIEANGGKTGFALGSKLLSFWTASAEEN